LFAGDAFIVDNKELKKNEKEIKSETQRNIFRRFNPFFILSFSAYPIWKKEHDGTR